MFSDKTVVRRNPNAISVIKFRYRHTTLTIRLVNFFKVSVILSVKFIDLCCLSKGKNEEIGLVIGADICVNIVFHTVDISILWFDVFSNNFSGFHYSE